jgi:hypothetical protein
MRITQELHKAPMAIFRLQRPERHRAGHFEFIRLRIARRMTGRTAARMKQRMPKCRRDMIRSLRGKIRLLQRKQKLSDLLRHRRFFRFRQLGEHIRHRRARFRAMRSTDEAFNKCRIHSRTHLREPWSLLRALLKRFGSMTGDTIQLFEQNLALESFIEFGDRKIGDRKIFQNIPVLNFSVLTQSSRAKSNDEK